MHETHLNHKYAHTLQQIFQHPASHHLEWHDVMALVRDCGAVREEDNGRLTFTISGISEVFHRSPHKDACDVQQALEIRSFLEKAGFKKDGAFAAPEPAAEPGDPTEKELHSHDKGRGNAEQNRHTEQQLKTQQHEQNERSAFQGGNAQSHQQGNRQK